MKALISHPFGEIDGELGVDLVPVLTPSVPLFRNVHYRQIQHFQQTVVRLEYGFCLGDLPQLAVKTFNRVRRIDQAADCFRVLEIRAQIRSVLPA